MAVILSPLQYPLARALIAQEPDCELWYGRPPDGDPAAEGARPAELHAAAAARAALCFEAAPVAAPHARAANGPLWERLERLGIESGRLGSERSDVAG